MKRRSFMVGVFFWNLYALITSILKGHALQMSITTNECNKQMQKKLFLQQ